MKENMSRMESEICNMRREMDELRNVVKDRAVDNLEIIQIGRASCRERV